MVWEPLLRPGTILGQPTSGDAIVKNRMIRYGAMAMVLAAAAPGDAMDVARLNARNLSGQPVVLRTVWCDAQNRKVLTTDGALGEAETLLRPRDPNVNKLHCSLLLGGQAQGAFELDFATEQLGARPKRILHDPFLLVLEKDGLGP